MSNYLRFATSGWLTPIYLLILAGIVLGVAANVVRERRMSAQIVGGMVLIPLLLRLTLIK
ncbi:MAG: hypothetical protein NUW23_01605 [Firmicutes bacterium]|jgi:hypothetical protein|nr:hypothetical protein [Bacillota bacterium]